MKIGFFDSGIGGFTILTAVRKMLPEYDYVYYGDTVNLPYGDKTEAEIYAWTSSAVIDLFSRDVKLVVIACNTASAETLRRLQHELLPNKFGDRRILGVIIPTIETLIETKTNHVILIGTTRTISSHKYEIELAHRQPNQVQLYAIATPELVPQIEANNIFGAMHSLEVAIERVVGKVDTIVLGCTHYVLLKDRIRERYPYLRVITQDEIIPHKLFSYLVRHPEISSELSRNGSLEIVLSNDEEAYRQKMVNLFTV